MTRISMLISAAFLIALGSIVIARIVPFPGDDEKKRSDE